jgi:uncharacterized protein YjcR
MTTKRFESYPDSVRAEAKHLYERSILQLKAIYLQCGISRSTLLTWAKTHGWTRRNNTAKNNMCPRCKEQPRIEGLGYCRPCRNDYNRRWSGGRIERKSMNRAEVMEHVRLLWCNGERTSRIAEATQVSMSTVRLWAKKNQWERGNQ